MCVLHLGGLCGWALLLAVATLFGDIAEAAAPGQAVSTVGFDQDRVLVLLGVR